MVVSEGDVRTDRQHRAKPGLVHGVAVAVSALLASAAALHADPCPFSEFSLTDDIVGVTRAASLDSIFGDPSVSDGHEVAFDLVSGHLRLFSGAQIYSTFARMRDAYELTGVPAGTSLTCTAELRVSGALLTSSSCGTACGVRLFGTIRNGDFNNQYEASFDNVPLRGLLGFDGVARLQITIAAAHPTTIEFELMARRGGAGGHAIVSEAQIDFIGLPPGVAVVSCQGYGRTQVPARQTSWGAIKCIYR